MNVAALGLGTYRISSEALPDAVRRAGRDLETAWVDTAPNYLHGRAHALLAPLLAEHPASVLVSTKVGFMSGATADAAEAAGALSPEDAKYGHSLSADYVRWQCARNRAELGRSPSVVFAHNPEQVRGDLYAVLRDAFAVLEAEAMAGKLGNYGVATWDGFDSGRLSVPELDRLAAEAAGTERHHLRAVQLPVSLVTATAFSQALSGQGPIAEASARGWGVFASAPLFGGELPELATRELADLLSSDLGIAQACLLAVASCPGVTRVLLSASGPAHWSEARAALAQPLIPLPILRKVLDVLSAD